MRKNKFIVMRLLLVIFITAIIGLPIMEILHIPENMRMMLGSQFGSLGVAICLPYIEDGVFRMPRNRKDKSGKH